MTSHHAANHSMTFLTFICYHLPFSLHVGQVEVVLHLAKNRILPLSSITASFALLQLGKCIRTWAPVSLHRVASNTFCNLYFLFNAICNFFECKFTLITRLVPLLTVLPPLVLPPPPKKLFKGLCPPKNVTKLAENIIHVHMMATAASSTNTFMTELIISLAFLRIT